jgi:hypothetical protein
MKAKVILLICICFGIIQGAQAQRYDDNSGNNRSNREHQNDRYRDNDPAHRERSQKYNGDKYKNHSQYPDRENRNEGGDRHHDRNRKYDHKPDEMDESDFAQALYTIKNAWFSSTQLTIAQSVVNSNWLSTNQIIKIMNNFSFESTKLSFAKYAYPKCVDPGNYFRVANVFSFSSSKEDLTNFISGH